MRSIHSLAEAQPNRGQLVYYTANGHHGVARYVHVTLIDNTRFDVVTGEADVT